MLLDWRIAETEREFQEHDDEFTVLRRMPNMRHSKPVSRRREDVVLKTDPRILDCVVS